MKKLFFAIVLLATMSGAWAQTSCVPDLLNATAVVRDANGNPVTTQVDVKVEIYHGDPAAGGTLAFCEQQQNIQPNSFGEITIQFGAGNLLCVPPNTLLSAFQWQNCAQGATHFKLSWRVTGAPNYTDIVINKFATVPYSFVSRSAESLSISATAGQVLKYDGTKWAAGTDNTGSAGYTAGSGINISGNTISSTVAGVPVGTVLPFAGNTPPAGYLLCDGSQVSRTTYAALFSTIGNAWGGGDGINTFHLPDMRGRFLRGVSGTSAFDPDRNNRVASNVGGNTGNNVGSFQIDGIVSHTHTEHFTGGNNTGQLSNIGVHGTTNSAGAQLGVQTEATGGNETRPKNVYVNYIIKF